MARQIFVLNVLSTPTALDVSGVFWVIPPGNLIKPLPGFTSAVPVASAVAWGATPAEVLALQAGTVVEQAFDTGQQNVNATLAQAEALLQSMFTTAQTAVTGQKVPSAKYVGSYFDSIAGWTINT